MASTLIDDAKMDLDDALEAFEENPSADTLDDVYRATTAIESACQARLKAIG